MSASGEEGHARSDERPAEIEGQVRKRVGVRSRELVLVRPNEREVLAELPHERLYFARFELKRMRALIAKMELAPPRLADRLESLFGVSPEAAAAELGRPVEETRVLVAREFPDLELPLRFPPGTRQEPWR